MSNSTFPSSLHTNSPAEGHALALRLAEGALALQAGSASMAEHLSTRQALPSTEVLTALYFQTVSAANGAWNNTH